MKGVGGGNPGAAVLEELLEGSEPVCVVAMEHPHEAGSVMIGQVLHHRVDGPVVTKGFVGTLILPRGQRVLGASPPGVGVGGGFPPQVAEKALDMGIEVLVGDGQARVDIVGDGLGPV